MEITMSHLNIPYNGTITNWHVRAALTQKLCYDSFGQYEWNNQNINDEIDHDILFTKILAALIGPAEKPINISTPNIQARIQKKYTSSTIKQATEIKDKIIDLVHKISTEKYFHFSVLYVDCNEINKRPYFEPVFRV